MVLEVSLTVIAMDAILSIMDKVKTIIKETGWYLVVAVVVLFPLAVYILFSSHQKPQIPVVVSPTPIPFSQTIPNTQFTPPDDGYSLNYPSAWKPQVYEGDPIVNLSFVVDGKVYKLVVSPPGQINPEGTNPDTTTTDATNISYSGQLFTRTIWKNNGVPFYIVAVPQSDIIPYFFSMELPPKNPDLYIQVFDQILASAHFANR